MSTLDILRIIFGGLFILFVPGLSWSYVFFARKNIDWMERAALALGLSIALVPMVIFWLYFVFHLKITLVSTCITVCGLTLAAVVVILVKRKFVRLEAKT
jgi:uncharacterized membrane protein